MVKTFRRLFLFFCLLLSLCGWPEVARAEAVTVVRVSPTNVDVGLGEKFSVDIVIENVQELYAFDIIIGFDSSYLTVGEVELGDFIDEGEIPPVVFTSPGRIQFVFTQTGTATQKTGTGTLITVNFTANGLDSSTEVDILSAELTRKNSVSLIPCDLQGGVVNIGEPKTAYFVFIPFVIAGID